MGSRNSVKKSIRKSLNLRGSLVSIVIIASTSSFLKEATKDAVVSKPRVLDLYGYVSPLSHLGLMEALVETYEGGDYLPNLHPLPTIFPIEVEVKQALSRGEQHASARSTNPSEKYVVGRTGEARTKKIFVGGLPSSLTEEAFREYFEAYGPITDVIIMFDQSTQRPRGFGFISFESEDSVDRVLRKTYHDLDGKLVEVKRALPKEANPGSRSASGSMASQAFGSSNANAGSYDGRADGNQYMQHQQQFAGGYTSYGVPGYGYGTAGGAVGYGGGYGMGGGYGGPSGSYGNSTGGGYAGDPLVASRSPWSGQHPSGYGGPGVYGPTSGYNGTGWSGPATGSGNFAPVGGRSGGATGYGSQGYGYGGYGASDGQNEGAYGSIGRHGGNGGHPDSADGSGNDQGAGSGYNTGRGYGDASGAMSYPNNNWSTGSQQGGYVSSQADGTSGEVGNYGSSYGNAQAMHRQQQ